MRDERIKLRDALAKPGSFLGLSNARVYDVLRHAPHLGNTGAKKILVQCRIWPLTKLKDVTPQDRKKILECLPPRAR